MKIMDNINELIREVFSIDFYKKIVYESNAKTKKYCCGFTEI